MSRTRWLPIARIASSGFNRSNCAQLGAGRRQLSNSASKPGTTDYLEVLTNETNAFSAELELAQAQGNELMALVQLYQALGGGWQE